MARPLLGAVGMVARGQLRRRWVVLVATGLLIGLAGAAVGSGAALIRRTATSYDRLERATLVPDLQITMTSNPDLAFRAAAVVPGVSGVWVTRALVARVENRPDVRYIGALEGHPVGSDPGAYTPVLVAGRFYDPDAREAVLDERAASAYGVHVGDLMPLRMLTQSDYQHFDTGFAAPGGPAVSIRITGLVRMAGLALNQTPLLLAPAAAAALPSVGMLVAIRLVPGPHAVSRADAAVARAAAVAGRDRRDPDAAEFPVLDVTHPATDSDPRVAATRRVLVTGLVVFVVAVAITGLATGAAAFARQHDLRWAEQRIEAVLGLPPAARVAARVLAALPAALLAGLVAAAGPLVTGGLGPIGPLAAYEPHPGYAPDGTASLVTGLVTGALVVLLAGWSAARAGRVGRAARGAAPRGGRDRRVGSSGGSPVADGWVLGDGRRAAWGGPGPAWPGPAWLWVGVRFAVGSRVSPLIRRPALFTAAAAVATLVAAATVGQGVTRLVHEPDRYGWSFDLYVNDVRPEIVTALRADPWISAVSEAAVSTVQVGAGCALGTVGSVQDGSPEAAVPTGPAPRTAPPDLTGGGTPMAPTAAPVVPRRLASTSPGELSVQAASSAATGSRTAGCAQFPAYAFTAASGHVGWTMLAGRLVAGPGEVVVGTRAASTLRVGVGDTVDLAAGPSGGGQPLRLKVVGVGLGPAISGERLGANLLLDPSVLTGVQQTAPLHEAFVRAADGVPVSRLVADLGARYEVGGREPPEEVTNLGGIGGLPGLLQVVLGLLAAGAVAHTVLRDWRRRAADVAVLRVLGATPPSIGAIAVTAAAVAALVAVLIGVPVGLGVGRLIWWEIANAVGVGTDVALPTGLLLALPVTAAALAVLVAGIPTVRRRWRLPNPRNRVG
jgi:hypothetical protein